MENKYVPTVGLEIHAELKTKSKMFCSCVNNPDEEKTNINICPICVGHPGTLPVLNMQAIKNILRIGIAVGGELADFTEWDRKNYFYPDIPKGYQISQYKFPLVSGGSIAGVQIERIHLEEDTAQSTHDVHEDSLINFNRSGVPLLELVTKPVIHDAETALRFAKELQLLLRYLGISDANMEKGEMRVEANISVCKDGRLGTKTEVKNLNSFRSVEKSIQYEVQRQITLLEKGDKVVQDTRGWDDVGQKTFSQRIKESSHDYRYFPDPDIPKLKISEIPQFDRKTLEDSMPELPWQKRDRYNREYGTTEKENSIFIESPIISSYFEEVISPFKKDAKMIRLAINYLLTDYLGLIKKNGKSNDDSVLNTIPTGSFSELMDMINKDEISSRGAKDILALLFTDNHNVSPRKLAQEKDLIQKSGAEELGPIVDKIISDNRSVVYEYKKGKTASLQFIIGQVMKATKGSANPTKVRDMVLEKMK